MALAGWMAMAVWVYGSNSKGRSVEPLPDPRFSSYKGADDMETLEYIRDTATILQKEHQGILEAIERLEKRMDTLEKKIEASRKP